MTELELAQLIKQKNQQARENIKDPNPKPKISIPVKTDWHADPLWDWDLLHCQEDKALGYIILGLLLGLASVDNANMYYTIQKLKATKKADAEDVD